MKYVMISGQFELHQLPTMALPVVDRALTIIDERYGTGFPNFYGGLEGGRAYHNGYHTRTVILDFEKLSQEMDLTETERVVGICACSAHDIEHDLDGVGLNEEASVDWLRRNLASDTPLDEPYIQMGCIAILGTVPIFENGLLVSQSVNELSFKSKRDEVVARMVASADLGRLFSVEGPLLGHLLLKEINNCSPLQTLEFARVIEFQRTQLSVLDQYKYPLPEATRILAKGRATVIKYAEFILKMVESGAISSWDELLNRDIAFMQSS